MYWNTLLTAEKHGKTLRYLSGLYPIIPIKLYTGIKTPNSDAQVKTAENKIYTRTEEEMGRINSHSAYVLFTVMNHEK